MATPQKWDTSYEWKAVALLALGFGMVGLDRWIIASLLPNIGPDLGITEADGQRIVGYLGLAWGVFAILSGRLGDKFGHRKVVIPAIFLFSIASFLSGLANTVVTLILIRVLMGLTEGMYTPTSFAAVAAAAHPSRRGFLQGLQQCGFALFGLALAPLIAGYLLTVVPSWRQVLWVVAIPGMIIGVLLMIVLREPSQTMGGHVLHEDDKPAGGWTAVLNKNIVLCMLALAGAMACVFVLGGVLPTYLQNYLGLTQVQALTVASGLGFGGFVGQFGVPGLSDMFGRKVMAIVGFLGAALSVYYFQGLQASAGVGMLFTVLAVTSFFALGNVALITGPIATESAPAGLVAAGIGLVVGAGEIFGGGIAPILAGSVIDAVDLHAVMYVAFTGALFGVLVSLFLTETAPSKIGVPAPQAAAARR